MTKRQNYRKQRLLKRNELIINRFFDISSKKYKGESKLYSNETILTMLSDEFHLSVFTIEDIVFGRVKYRNRG